MEERFNNYVINHLYSNLDKKHQNSLYNELSDIDSYISRLIWRIDDHIKDILDSKEYIKQLENQIEDLQSYIKNLKYTKVYDTDIFKVILKEVKDPETLLAIAKAVWNHGHS